MCKMMGRKKQEKVTPTPVVASTESRAAVQEANMADLERRRRGGISANILTSPAGVPRWKHRKATKRHRAEKNQPPVLTASETSF